MAETGKIIWLASYPKSGNTWLRVFFANLISNQTVQADINDLQVSTIASNRTIFDEFAGISSSDLSQEEIERMRPYVYDEISQTSKLPLFFKIHDAFTFTSENKPLVSESASLKAIYVIRNPLAVAVSFAHHLGVPPEIAIHHMNDTNYKFFGDEYRIGLQLEQKLLTWSQHVLSWTEQKHIPIHVVRYEDMVNEPFETFQKTALFCGISFDDEKLKNAIKNSSFEKLQAQEMKAGFKEKPAKAAMFFRKGIIDSWKAELTPALIDKIKIQHGVVMKKYHYL